MKASASSRTIATLGIDIGKNTFCPALAPVRPGSFFLSPNACPGTSSLAERFPSKQEEHPMKLAYATLVTLVASGTAFAGGGAPVPEGSQEPDPSGRPSAVLDDAKCQSVWKMAAPDGDTLSQDKAVPFVVNFQMVDTNKDGKVSADEFKTGCSKGWIQEPDAATVDDMKKTGQ